MKVCARCGSEYLDTVDVCADDGTTLSPAAAEPVRQAEPDHDDDRRFVRVGIAEDPLTAQVLGDVVRAAGIPVLVQERQGGSVDMLTTGSFLPWWEIQVPEQHQVRAAGLVTDEKVRLTLDTRDAEQAAEAEERETEGGSP